MSHQELISNNLVNEFKTCTQLQYNGKLNIKSSKGSQWTFYYRLGRIVWATGGAHPFRRWRRHIAQNCPQINVDKLQLNLQDLSIDYWDYHLLEIFYKKQKIQREQINSIVDNTIAELLFDLALQGNFASISCNRSQDVILETPMSFTSAEMSVKHMQDSWKIWSEAGLANFSPDLAPVLRRSEQLEQMVSPSVYKNFVNLINGNLAMKMKQSVLPLTRSLLPYILKGIIELVEVPDLPLGVSEVNNNSTTPQANKGTAPLIACVDDSLLVCKILEDIITSNGLRFVKIQDPVQALPTLIQDKPDLIFLDLIMPIVSGYEICTQLRRISTFSNTPIIILTGSDNFLDRVRAKVVGSTDFFTKPVVADKVMGIIRKYLPTPSASTEKTNTEKTKSNLEVCN
jgi:two-component system, chemotaxis family, response regulator PixG